MVASEEAFRDSLVEVAAVASLAALVAFQEVAEGPQVDPPVAFQVDLLVAFQAAPSWAAVSLVEVEPLLEVVAEASWAVALGQAA